MNMNSYDFSGRPTPGRFRPLPSPKQAATRDQRMVAAICHLAILANLFTFLGGVAICAFLYLLARRRVRFVEEQAARSLVFQLGVWGIIGAGWLFYRLLPEWLSPFIFNPIVALVWFVAAMIALWRAGRFL